MDELGLSEWFEYKHTAGGVTALRQTSERLLLAIGRASGAEWLVFDDVHGTHCIGQGHARDLQSAKTCAESFQLPAVAADIKD